MRTYHWIAYVLREAAKKVLFLVVRPRLLQYFAKNMAHLVQKLAGVFLGGFSGRAIKKKKTTFFAAYLWLTYFKELYI